MRKIVLAAVLFTVGACAGSSNTERGDSTSVRGGGSVTDTTKQDQTTLIVPSGEAQK
jgi:hypothetical protein